MCVSAAVVGPPSPISRAQVDVFLSQALADQLFLLQVRRPSPAGGQPLLRTCAVARGAGGVCRRTWCAVLVLVGVQCCSSCPPTCHR